jgi:hypothetical protein
VPRHTWRTTQCRDAECGSTIIWAVTPSGKNTPVDAEPSASGNIVLAGGEETSQTAPVAQVVDPASPPLGGWGPLHTSHFVTCPAADRWRSKKRTH